jgi:hypothetical protein
MPNSGAKRVRVKEYSSRHLTRFRQVTCIVLRLFVDAAYVVQLCTVPRIKSNIPQVCPSRKRMVAHSGWGGKCLFNLWAQAETGVTRDHVTVWEHLNSGEGGGRYVWEDGAV